MSLRSWLCAGLAVAVACLGLQFAGSNRGLDLPLYDFAEYWAAGRLLARGENPYDAVRVGELEATIGRDGGPLLMWNPPWTLPLVLPFALLSPGLAHALWLLLSFALILASADVAWRMYGGTPGSRGIAWVLAFTFVPTFLTLYLGQIAALPLAGAVLFLRFERRGQHVCAGAATVLMAVKPHLFTALWMALVIWSLDRRRWRVLAGAAGATAAATLVAMSFDPAVLNQYRNALTLTPPVQYRSPTVGTVIRLLFGESHFGLQFVALAPAVAWIAFDWHRHRHDWDWSDRLPSLLFASLLTASYGAWPFDLVVLLIPILRIAVRTERFDLPAAIYLAANGVAALFVLATVDFFWWIWLTPALLVAYASAWSLARSADQGRVVLSGDSTP